VIQGITLRTWIPPAVAIAALYAATGTLNLADLALRVPRVAPGDVLMVRAAALLLLAVFAVKAAVFPLYLWLPRAYAAAPAPVAALFAIMTKVGVYAIVRVHGLVFGPDAGPAAFVAGAPGGSPARGPAPGAAGTLRRREQARRSEARAQGAPQEVRHRPLTRPRAGPGIKPGACASRRRGARACDASR